jgi:hypothetical protein
MLFINGFNRQPLDFNQIPAIGKFSYCSGLFTRFSISLIGTPIELAFQILQSISTTFEYILAKGESLLTRRHINRTWSFAIHCNYSLTVIITKLRFLSFKEPENLAKDLGFIALDAKLSSLSSRYRGFLEDLLNIWPEYDDEAKKKIISEKLYDEEKCNKYGIGLQTYYKWYDDKNLNPANDLTII